MNSSRQRVVLYAFWALLVAAAILAVALHGRGGGGKGGAARPATSSSSAPTRSTAAPSRTPRHTRPHQHPRRSPRRPPRAVHWQTAALATARTFVTWFDRWLAGETSGRQAPDVTPGYAAKLRATVTNVPPGAQ